MAQLTETRKYIYLCEVPLELGLPAAAVVVVAAVAAVMVAAHES